MGTVPSRDVRIYNKTRHTIYNIDFSWNILHTIPPYTSYPIVSSNIVLLRCGKWSISTNMDKVSIDTVKGFIVETKKEESIVYVYESYYPMSCYPTTHTLQLCPSDIDVTRRYTNRSSRTIQVEQQISSSLFVTIDLPPNTVTSHKTNYNIKDIRGLIIHSFKDGVETYSTIYNNPKYNLSIINHTPNIYILETIDGVIQVLDKYAETNVENVVDIISPSGARLNYIDDTRIGDIDWCGVHLCITHPTSTSTRVFISS